jgi:dipeptidyl aminopeptidase/acylaminoacyl peptidase
MLPPNFLRASLLSALLCCPAVAETAPADKAPLPMPLTVEDLWALERVGSPAVSPDGKWLAYVVTTFDREKNAGTGQLWLVPTDGSAPPRRLTFHDAGGKSPAFSPDGKFLVFSSKRGEGPAQLYRISLEGGGEPEQLTTLPVSPSDVRFFPDGKSLAFVANTFPDLDDDFAKVKERLDSQKNDKSQVKISDNRTLRYWDHYLTDGSVTHVFKLDLASRKVTDLLPGRDPLVGFESLEWDLSPDGKEIAWSVNSTSPPFKTLDFNIELIEVETGKARPIGADNLASDSGPVYSPDGKYLLWGRNLRPDWPSEQNQLVRYDRKSGEIKPLLAGWDRDPSSWRVSSDGKTVVFVAQENGRQNLYSVGIDGGTPRLLVAGGNIGSPRPAGSRVVYQSDGFYRPANFFSVPAAGGDAKQLTDHNKDRLAGIAKGKVESITYAGAGGADVQMWLHLPPGFDPAKKWPLLMLLHGGPHGASLESFHYRWNAELFAAKGYIVAQPNFHGSTGFGQAFADAIVGRHGDKPFEDVMKAVDLLVARGYVDEKRLAAAGGSYGGYLVSWLLGHTDRFAAIINHAGVYDLNAQFASDMTYGRSFAYGSEPWEDPMRIDEQSPSRFAKNFDTPTLILHGELDYRVPYTQGVMLHGVLTAKGVPSRIVIFPQENHWILKPQSAEIWWREVFAWLAKYLPETQS